MSRFGIDHLSFLLGVIFGVGLCIVLLAWRIVEVW